MSWPTPSLRRRSKQVARRPQTRPAVEIVEDRTLLTAYIVDSDQDSGTGTLRDIIQQLNTDPSASNTIEFASNVTNITLSTSLAAIARPVVLNSTNRTDVTIDGGGNSFDAITLGTGSDGSTVQFLNIRNFGGVGVVVRSANDEVVGNIIGGVSTGVRVTGAGATDAKVLSNRIGVDAADAASPVTIGVLVDQAGAFTIAGNTIGNAFTAGVQILNTTAGGAIFGNFIGMTSTGAAPINGDGVQIYQSTDVDVGGFDPDLTNYIGNSSGSGVVIAGASATRNSVLFNVIGFTAGSPALPAPNNYGVSINGSAGNTIDTNQIDASVLSGVHLFNTPVAGNSIVANQIGTLGTTPAAKNAIGIEIISGQGNTIGGADAGEGNVIVQTTTAGVVISGASSGNRLLGNLIGTDENLSEGLGNPYGVLILGGSNNTVGGSGAGEGNTIGDSALAGVSIVAGSNDFVVQNLYVGANGPPDGFPAGDINLAGTANGGIQPPVIGTVSLSSTPNEIDVSFTSAVAGSLVELYTVTGASRTYVASATVGADLRATFTATLPQGAVIAVTASSTAGTSSIAGTSAFSARSSIADDLTVVNDSSANIPGSLFYAITKANSLAGGGTIRFLLDAAESVITVDSAFLLPTITKRITFDTSGSPPITISAGAGVFDGFVLGPGSGGTVPGSGTVINSLTFKGFLGAAIRIQTDYNSLTGVSLDSNKSGIEVLGSHNTIAGGTYTSNTTGVTLGGVDNSITDPTFTGGGTALRVSGSSQKVIGVAYTGTAADTAIIVDGNDSTITDGVFTTYATGIRVTGTRTVITGSKFSTGGTAISLAGGNNQVTGVTFGDPAADALNLGVLVQGSFNKILNNHFIKYRNSGLQVVVGGNNTITGNDFTLKSADPAGAAGAIVVAPGANQGILPAEDLVATRDGTSITFQFNIAGGGPDLSSGFVQVYQLDKATNKVTRVDFAPSYYNLPLHVGSNTLSGTLPAGTPQQEFLILITSSTVDGSTSAFSSPTAASNPNVVTNLSDAIVEGRPVDGSLRRAIQYVSGLTDPNADHTIIFDIRPSLKDAQGYWTIVLSSPLVATGFVIIDGWQTPVNVFGPDGKPNLSPVIRLEPNAGQWQANGSYNSALVFAAGSANSEVRGLNFTGFTTQTSAIEIQVSGVKVIGSQFLGAVPDANGVLPSPAGVGVKITGGQASQIGGYVPTGDDISIDINPNQSGNVFGYLATGVEIAGPATSLNQVGYNRIGTNGYSTFGNGTGVLISNSPGNLVYLNLIGNNNTGVRITRAGATNNRIAGNDIGVVSYREPGYDAGNVIGVRIDTNASNNALQGYTLTTASPPSTVVVWNVIGHSSGSGVLIQSRGNQVFGSYIGTDSQARNLGNQIGVRIQGSDATDNLIGGVRNGGLGDNLANEFGWNTTAVLIDQGAGKNWLRNNFIGTSRFGAAIPNMTGVNIHGANSNSIGPDPKSAASPLANNLLAGANFISGNLGNGVVVDGGSSYNQIRGNLIGRGQVGGYAFAGNAKSGVVVGEPTASPVGSAVTPFAVATSTATSNGIGGAPASPTSPSPLQNGVANLILGNYIGVILYGTAGTLIGGNQISQNLLNGASIASGSNGAAVGVQVVGNIIGMGFNGAGRTDANGATTGNGTSGIVVDASQSTARVFIQGNLISSNGLDGIQVTTGDATSAIADVRIDGNIIGLDINGDSNANLNGNVRDGVHVQNVGGVQVGVTTANYRRSNVISGNLGRGVGVYWTVAPPSLDGKYKTTIVNNVIGADSAGIVNSAHAPGNLGDGVWMFGGGETDVINNLVAGNRGAGIHAFGGLNPGSKITIATNLVFGTDELGGLVGNGSDGIFLDSIRPDVVPTGQDPVLVVGNLIGANRANGIQLLQCSYVTIIGNWIGDIGQIFHPNPLTPAEDGNGSNGVFLNGSSRITVGAASAFNVISGNRGDGVVISGNLKQAARGSRVQDPSKLGNTIAGNLIGLANDGLSMVGNHNSGVVVGFSSYNQIGTATAPNVISGNRLYGVVVVGLQEGGETSARSNSLVGNRIGTTGDGSAAAPNSSDGVFLLNAQSTIVGGGGGARNIISGNSGQGLRVFGQGASGNQILNNFIGLNSAGTAAIANAGNGVIMDQVTGGAPDGPNVISGNTISGNAQSGLLITSTTLPQSAGGVSITRNFIGTDSGGSYAVPNSGYGISLFGASDTRVGEVGQGNVISGNNLDGVLIYTPSNNAPADRNILVGNYIGTNATGTAAVSNQGNGVHIINSSNNQIGQLGAQAGSTGGWNVISGNRSSGILVEALNTGVSTPAASANVIAGNFIGTDSSGTQPITVMGPGGTPAKVQQFGVLLSNAVNTIVGRTSVTDVIDGTAVPVAGRAANVISANDQADVYLTGNTTGAWVLGNYLGVDYNGSAYDAQGGFRDLASKQAAVLIDANASNNLIGGLPMTAGQAVPGTGNIITQNWINKTTSDVVGVLVNSPFATNNQIASNLIGLDANGRAGGNTIGVLLNNGISTTIGGLTTTPPGTDGKGPYSSFGNVISGNSTSGVEITGPLAMNDVIYGNFIGTSIDGKNRPILRSAPTQNPLYRPSQLNGVQILQGTGHVVGGAGRENLISDNSTGVSIAALQSGGSGPSGVLVESNYIGTDRTGMVALPNYGFGVLVTASAGNVIRNNLLSANGVAGVEIVGGRNQGGNAASLANTITGNKIGVNRDGQVAFAVTDGTRQISPISQHPAITLPDGLVINYGFQNNGVVVIGASDNLVTGGNTISGNIQVGVYITRIDNLNNTYGVPTGNVVQGNNLGLNGIYGVFRYDAPNGNPADANTFTGTPIPIGDFVTGLNPTTPSNPATSILLGGQRPASSTPSRPRIATPPRRARPALPSRPQLAQAARLQGTR